MRILLPLPLAALAVAASAQAFELHSADLSEQGRLKIDQVYQGNGCQGGNRSPQLSWSGEPAGTKAFAITIYDPDASAGKGWWHWLVYDIPADVHSLEGGIGKGAALPAGARQGRNSFGEPAFGGACPPVGDPPHHYIVTVYALGQPRLELPTDAAPAVVSEALQASRLGSATLTGRYGR